MFTRRSLLKQTAASAFIAPWLCAQEEATFSSDVKVVSVLATVRTKAGEIVRNLSKEDFVLTDNGRTQKVKYFSRESDLPLILGLLVDTSGSQRMVLGQEQEASFRFIDKVLRDVDRTFVVHFDYRPELFQNLTSSKEKIGKALERLNLPFQFRGGGGGGTTLYDAIYLCSNIVMQKETGRKALILLTDGEDNGSHIPIETSIEAAQRADSLIYSILFADDSFGGRRQFGPDGKGVLQKLSRETGGGFFEVSKKRPLDVIFQQLQDELRSQYSFGYTADDTATKGFRKIKITTRRKGLVVQARSGYYQE